VYLTNIKEFIRIVVTYQYYIDTY